MKLLSQSYSAITKTFRLTEKADFRRKFGTSGSPEWVSSKRIATL